MKRRLIVCSDGTWQDLAKNYPTNVRTLAKIFCGMMVGYF